MHEEKKWPLELHSEASLTLQFSVNSSLPSTNSDPATLQTRIDTIE